MSEFIQSLFGLDGRISIVTGASSGIGRRIAFAHARAGAKVILVGRRKDNLREAAAEIKQGGGEGVVLSADLSQDEEVLRVGEESSRFFGAPDILVNAAGMNLRKKADDINKEDWNATLHLNLSAPFFLARALIGGMQSKGFGAIINIASLQTFRAGLGDAAYGSSKGGVGQLTRAMAKEWSGGGVIINAIAPGFFPTEMTKVVFGDDELAARLADSTLIKRNGELADMDGAAIFLASRAAAYITGIIVPVDGGFLAK